jgi:dTDP-4-amino-4,6-dideoxygalactose transaminase
VTLLRSHGITKDESQFKKKSDGDWYYEQQALGFNYRLTDIQAALGISQLKRLDNFVAKRQKIATLYLRKLKDVVLPYQHPETNSSWHLFVIQVKDRKAAYQRLKTQGIMTQVHYIPVHTQPYYQNKGFKKGDYPVSELYYQSTVSIPIYPDLLYENQDRVIFILNELVE